MCNNMTSFLCTDVGMWQVTTYDMKLPPGEFNAVAFDWVHLLPSPAHAKSEMYR